MKEIFKRLAALLLATALVIGFFPALTRAETTATEISSLDEITDLAGSYILTGDTTVTAPIGSSTTPFTGSFDGNGKTITVNITATSDYAGIFAAIGEGATVSNFKIVDSSVTTTEKISYMGLVAGSCAGTISNVVVENGTVQGYALLGGIAGFLDTTGTVTACAVESGKIEKTVTYGSDSYYGGIVGHNKGTVSLCSNGATIDNTSGSASAGYFSGITGLNMGTIIDCYNFGTVDASTTKSYRVAGIAGQNENAIENCHNYGTVTSNANYYRAVAYPKYGYQGTITNCYYLDTCGVTDTKATSKTALEFEALASTLGENWVDGNANYPVLSWQTWKIGGGSTEPAEGSYTVEHYTENLDGEGYTLATTTAGDTAAGETATAEATELEGFTFDETNENNITTGTVTEDGSLVLKLYYSRNSYTLTWDVADGTITSEEGTYTAGSVKYEAPITAPTVTAAGREFASWSPVVETMPAQDLTITAVWTAKFYDVHWDANGGELSTDLWTGQYGVTAGAQYGQPLNKYTYSEERPTWVFTRSLPDPEHATHVFDGWWTAAEGGELITGDMVITEPDNGESFTFYAHWLESYTVTLDPGEGKLTTKTYLVAKGQAFGTAVGSMPVASQYDYHHFNSWVNDDGEELTMDTIINSDVTYYATWNPNTAKVVFYANGGEGTMEDQIITYGDDQPLTKCTFTRAGYIFLGWATSSTATEATIADEATGVTDPTYNGRTYRLYAVWAECTHEDTTTTTVEATCTEDGSVTVTCDDCGATISTETTPATDHDFTYTDNGNDHTVTCANGCGYNVTEGHTYVDGACECGAIEAVEPETITVYAINSSNWNEVYAYVWCSVGSYEVAWPGTAMTKTEDTVNGFDVYSYTYPATNDMLIFNNNSGAQTSDLTGMDGKYYDIKTATWYNSLDEVPVIDPLATGVYMAGEFNGWTTLEDEFKRAEATDTVATLTLELAAETTYQFKIVNNGVWTSCSTAITGDVSGLSFSSGVNDNATITTAAAGIYTFTYDLVNNTLSVVYPEVVPAEPAEVEITFGYAVSFDSDLKMNYRIKLENIAAAIPNYTVEGAYLVVEKDQYFADGTTGVDTQTLTGSVIDSRLVFTLNDIQSVEMGSELRAVLHIFDTEGNEYYTPVDVISIKAYAQGFLEMLSYETNPEYVTMLIDLLNYGSAAQTYFGRRADVLANAGMDAYQQYATKELSEELNDQKTVVATERTITAVDKISFSVNFNDKTEMNAKLTLADGYTAEDITCVKVLDAEGNVVETLTEGTMLEDGKVQFTYYGVKSVQLREMYFFVAYVGEEVASDSNGYSIEAYCKGCVDNGTEAMADMGLKCMYYGDSAYAYFN